MFKPNGQAKELVDLLEADGFTVELSMMCANIFDEGKNIASVKAKE